MTFQDNFAVAFFLVFFLGIAVTLLLRPFAYAHALLLDIAEGDALKIHRRPIPLLGGISMMVSLAAGSMFLAASAHSPYFIWFFLGSLPVFLLGLWDDMKWKHVSHTRPLLKFYFLLAAAFIPALVVFSAGIRFAFFPVAALEVLLAFAYIFVCINAVNYQDGMDGLAGFLTLISLAGFMWISYAQSHFFAFGISIISFAAALSFLLFNLPPAKIFMGDTGSYLLGFIVAALAMLASKPYDIMSVVSPLLLIGLPLADGIVTNIRRVCNGKSIFLGDRSHFYDRLLRRGFSTKKTLAICLGLQAVLVIIGILFYA